MYARWLKHTRRDVILRYASSDVVAQLRGSFKVHCVRTGSTDAERSSTAITNLMTSNPIGLLVVVQPANALAKLQRIQIRVRAKRAQSIAILCQLQRSLDGAAQRTLSMD
jgi:hypothetical protein